MSRLFLPPHAPNIQTSMNIGDLSRSGSKFKICKKKKKKKKKKLGRADGESIPEDVNN